MLLCIVLFALISMGSGEDPNFVAPAYAGICLLQSFRRFLCSGKSLQQTLYHALFASCGIIIANNQPNVNPPQFFTYHIMILSLRALSYTILSRFFIK
jgi:hypothetical protein